MIQPLKMEWLIELVETMDAVHGLQLPQAIFAFDSSTEGVWGYLQKSNHEICLVSQIVEY